MSKLLSRVAAASGLVACMAPAPAHDARALASPDRALEHATPRHGDVPMTVVVVAIDGVRWQEVFLGTDRHLLDRAGLDAPTHARTADQLVPNLSELARGGVALGAPGHGAPFVASGPNFVSLPGYTELLTGRPATCQENDCDPPSGTLFDADWSDPPGSLALFASWDRLGAFAVRVPEGVVVSAGRHADSGGLRGAALGLLGFTVARPSSDAPHRIDLGTAAAALAHLEDARPAFVFVSLGDTDEAAHAGDYAAYLGALGRADAFVGELGELRRAWSGRRDLVVLVTTDHGRSDGFRDHGRDHPESARSFLIAGGGPIAARGWVACATPRRLADVAPTIASLAGVRWEPSGEGAGAPIPEIVADLDPTRTAPR